MLADGESIFDLSRECKKVLNLTREFLDNFKMTRSRSVTIDDIFYSSDSIKVDVSRMLSSGLSTIFVKLKQQFINEKLENDKDQMEKNKGNEM